MEGRQEKKKAEKGRQEKEKASEVRILFWSWADPWEEASRPLSRNSFPPTSRADTEHGRLETESRKRRLQSQQTGDRIWYGTRTDYNHCRLESGSGTEHM